MSAFRTTKKEKRNTIAAQLKGLVGDQARKLNNWLNPCCPFQLDKFTAEEAGKFDPVEWEGSIIYVNSVGGVFTEPGFYLSEEGSWIKSASSSSDDYTATETVIGTFLGKPLYRKVYSYDATVLSTAFSQITEDVSALNIEKLTLSNPTVIEGSTRNNNAAIQVSGDGNTLIIGATSTPLNSMTSLDITIEYTKTTD